LSQDYRRVALVSDGSRGIGAATVRKLAAAGWDVSFCHRGDEQAVCQVEKAVSELGGRVLAVEVDVTNAADVTSWFQQAHDELGPVQAAVSCAGMTRDQPLARLEEADWRAVLDTGLDGMFHICRAAMFAMMKRRSGRIVAVSSVCGAYDHSATHDQPAHQAPARQAPARQAPARQAPTRQAPARHWPVRAGIAGFVPALSALTSRFGVSVNAVTPGPATHDMTAILPELTRADLTETIALRRFDDASDVADLVTFLLSAACDITGRVLEVRSPISLLAPASHLTRAVGGAHCREPSSPEAPQHAAAASGRDTKGSAGAAEARGASVTCSQPTRCGIGAPWTAPMPHRDAPVSTGRAGEPAV
jgi:3-oxoacyl-[acyl-carrier protein] reductase